MLMQIIQRQLLVHFDVTCSVDVELPQPIMKIPLRIWYARMIDSRDRREDGLLKDGRRAQVERVASEDRKEPHVICQRPPGKHTPSSARAAQSSNNRGGSLSYRVSECLGPSYEAQFLGCVMRQPHQCLPVFDGKQPGCREEMSGILILADCEEGPLREYSCSARYEGVREDS